MTRHVIDRTRERTDAARVKAFVAIDRNEMVHPATKELIRRPDREDDNGRRTAEYARIARGRTA
ncbi:hypothetical protein [Phaeovulum veldkampii]|nr:hypothetical protein [Phaeovulum veldkampii]NCU19405.1 hypothetical protein [Candidatus Falkowbacteria bacterium]TDQ57305.1 hypothetical protein EV658_11383 [Phaeovulum veldkampii DSM 11550]